MVSSFEMGGVGMEVYLDEAGARKPSSLLVLIRSRGADGVFAGSVYVAGRFEAVMLHEDLVWSDGFWIRYPSWLRHEVALPGDRFVPVAAE